MRIFGFDPREAEEQVENMVEVKQITVEVTYRQTKTGQIIPLSFTWDDGRVYRIDKVLQVRAGHSLKAFSPGWRYYCQIGRRRFYLKYDTEKWYVEKTVI